MLRLAIVSILLLTPSFLGADEPAKPAPPALNASGCWSGYWISCTTGHKGPLSAKICKISDTCYEAHFKGRFALIIPFRYTAQMQVTGQEGDKLFLSSSRRLPLMGTFEMCAVVTPCNFTAEYTSRSDRGQFVMKRD
jgi:hypothetical protein